jgi:hypothetical protein
MGRVMCVERCSDYVKTLIKGGWKELGIEGDFSLSE